MRRAVLLASLLVSIHATPGMAQERPAEEVVLAAISPLPSDLKPAAGVVVESEPGVFDTVRESSNGMSCVLRLPSDVEKPVLDARCYSDLFWPSVFHRWTMTPAPQSVEETFSRMHADIASGVVEVPDIPTAGYRVFGPMDAFNFETGELGPALQKWQSIHFPFRTTAELGLTEIEEGSKDTTPGLMPFVMASGTWWSHVMIMHEPWPGN
jgi:hypothetical protein